MAETQNVFVTRTQNRFLPIIQAFNDNLYKHMQMQGELNDKAIAFNKQVENEQFISQYGKKITQAKSLEELTSTLSSAVTDAGGRGLTNALPIIQSIAQVHQQSIGLDEANRQANEYVGLLQKTYGDSMVLQDGKPVAFKDAVTSLGDIKDPISRRMNAEFLAKNVLKEYKDVIPEGKGYKYTSGYIGIDGKTYDTKQYNIIEDKKRGVLVDSDTTAGVSEGDQPLDPLVAKQYGMYKKQDKQLESYMSRVGGSGNDGYKVSDPRYMWKDKEGKEHLAYWDPNKKKHIDADTGQVVTGAVPYKNSNSYKEIGMTNLGIITDLRNYAKSKGKENILTELNAMPLTYGVGYYKDLPTESLEDFGRLLAQETGDNWDNPSSPELKRIKNKFGGTTINPFKQQFLDIFGVSKADTNYVNSALKD